MRDGQAGIGHPPWRGGGGGKLRVGMRLEAAIITEQLAS